MKLDLREAHAKEFRFHTHISISFEMFDKIIQLSNQSIKEILPTSGLPFAESYSQKGEKYAIIGFLSKPDEKGDSTLDISYIRNFRGKLERRLPKASSVLQILSQLKGDFEVFSVATFTYRLGRFISILPLPVSVRNIDNQPFDQIRGVRFAKYDGDKVKYSVVLDYPDRLDISSQSFEVIVNLRYVGSLTKDLPKKLFNELVKVATKFAISKERKRWSLNR